MTANQTARQDGPHNETYYPPAFYAREALYAEPTEWLCPACHAAERDVELTRDRHGYVCPACFGRYSEAELARAYRAALTGYWEREGEIRGDLDAARQNLAGLEAKLAAIRRVAA